jgi:soluble lytic murein transglycosylase-like protein
MSDTMFARSRLRASPWGIAARFTRLVLLSALTICVFQFTQLPGARMPMRPHFSMPHFLSVPAVTPTPLPRPSAFDEEKTMSPKALIDRWQSFIAEASRKFHVPQSWIRAVIRQESGGRTMSSESQPITSAVGAMGLMQMMPDTYAEMRDALHLGADPYDPHDNIIAGTAYLRWLHGKYGFPNMFGAYNDGPGNFDQYLAGTRTMPVETVSYLADLSAALGPEKPLRQRTQPA